MDGKEPRPVVEPQFQIVVIPAVGADDDLQIPIPIQIPGPGIGNSPQARRQEMLAEAALLIPQGQDHRALGGVGGIHLADARVLAHLADAVILVLLADHTTRLAAALACERLAEDGTRIEGVLVRPLDEQPGMRYPLAILPHGGPEGISRDGWNTRGLYPLRCWPHAATPC